MSEIVNTREIALDALIEINEKGMYSHIVLNNALKKYQYLDKNDRAFIQRVVTGTIEKQLYVDYCINRYSKVDTARMKPLIRTLFRMSVYQIMCMDKTPDSAVCNEAVKLATKRGFKSLAGFVNGVLRNIIRNKDLLTIENVRNNDKLTESEKLSILYSMPQWIIDKWSKCYNYETIETMLKYFDEDANTYVRMNENKASKEEIISLLQDAGVSTWPVSFVKGALKISNYDYLGKLDAFNKGLINVQDLSSMLVGIIASPKENDKVIDVCAAPGGKSTHIATLLNGTGFVDARDVSEYKVDLMNENISRLKLNNIKATIKDARVLYEEDIESADIVVCDLPCSGLGIIGRKPDIKYKITQEKQNELVKLSRSILEVAASYVKPGGRLVFSTCTINVDENEETAKWAASNLSLKFEPLTDRIDEKLLVNEVSKRTAAKGYIQLLPGIHGMDGFFIASFIKDGK